MGTILAQTKRYCFTLLDKAIFIDKDEYRVAYIKDLLSNKPVLIVHTFKNLLAKERNSLIFADILTNDNDKEHPAGLAIVDDTVFLKEKNNGFLFTSLLHELGHFINGDYNHVDNNYSKKRVEMLKQGIVMDEEYKADEFAARECGLNKVIKWLEYMEDNRKHYNASLQNYLLAINEFRMRKKHLLDVFNSK